jgi:hypothetical protein
MFVVFVCNLNIRMQIKALTLLMAALGLAHATFFDMPRIREMDFLSENDEDRPSLSEKLEAAELNHPLLGADRV